MIVGVGLLGVRTRPGVDYDCNHNRLQSITLFSVIIIVITNVYSNVIVIVINIMPCNHCNHQ